MTYLLFEFQNSSNNPFFQEGVQASVWHWVICKNITTFENLMCLKKWETQMVATLFGTLLRHEAKTTVFVNILDCSWSLHFRTGSFGFSVVWRIGWMVQHMHISQPLVNSIMFVIGCSFSTNLIWDYYKVFLTFPSCKKWIEIMNNGSLEIFVLCPDSKVLCWLCC